MRQRLSRAGVLALAFGLLVWVAAEGQETAPPGQAFLRLRTIVDQAGLKETPEFGSNSKVKLPLGTVLEAREKNGEWYMVLARMDQEEIHGYIHEMLVEVLDDSREPTSPTAGMGDPLAARIDRELERCRELVRNGRDLEQALDALDLMTARVLHIVDPAWQRRLAVEVFYWRGLALAALNDGPSALKEFRKMFEADDDQAREALRNVSQPSLAALIKQAERDFLGIEVEYVLEVLSLPEGAEVTVNGREKARAPAKFRATSPKFKVEVGMAGYKAVRDDVFLTSEFERKTYSLEATGRDVALVSHPAGAAIFLDGVDSGLKTDAILRQLAPGEHRVRLIKEGHLDWESPLTVEAGEGSLNLEANLVASAYESLAVWPAERGGELFRPTAIALDPDGFVLVTDESSARLRKYDAEGKWQKDWALAAEARTAVRFPAGIAVGGEGHIYLTDSFRHRVVKLDGSGSLVQQFGRQGTGPEDFWFPAGIALDSRGDVYIADRGNHRVKKYSSSGEFIKAWGSRGETDGFFNFPRAVAVNAKGEVFVLDKSRVQRFSSEGEFLGAWGAAGSDPGEFKDPLGLCVDRAGCLYVADSSNHRLQKFDDRGGLVVEWGGRGREPGKLSYPVGLVQDPHGRLLVVERDGNRVQAFDAPARPPR